MSIPKNTDDAYVGAALQDTIGGGSELLNTVQCANGRLPTNATEHHAVEK
jgi:hypothetical protein